MVSLSQSITDMDLVGQTFESLGLDFLGISALPGVQEHQETARTRYHRWLSQGNHGTMSFLERHEPAKYDPELALEGTRSILVAGLGYYQPRPEPGPSRGLVARYAWGRDYHKVILEKLKSAAEALARRWPDEGWRSFTDTAPLDERYWAERSGASFTARNGLAVNRTLGSWFLIGEILSTREFSPTPEVAHAHGSCPSACRRCRDVCPTGALDASGRMDARKCISYLTIEHRGPIDDSLKPGLGNRIFGCDLCQEVCPLNHRAPAAAEPQFLSWRAGPDLDLGEILTLDHESFTRRFGGSPVHRAGRDGLVRNACLVAANTGRSELTELINPLLADPDPGVSDAARWSLNQLSQWSRG